MRIDHDLLFHQPMSILAVSAGRFGATVSAFVGLAGLVVAVRALRQAGRVDISRPALTSIGLGVVGTVGGVVYALTADGGLGTGNGLGGAVVATVLGPLAVLAGGLAAGRQSRIARSARNGR